jgi:CRISPR system Cascade subunit CasE
MTLTLEHPPTALTTVTLTLVPLNHPNLSKIPTWSNRKAVHQAVMSFFPDNLAGDPKARRATAGVLHRHDTPANGPARLLIQHTTAMRADILDAPGLQHANLESLLTNIHAGDHVRFRVVLNAVRSQTKTKKRIPVTEEEDLVAWGLQRLATAGLEQIVLSDQPTTALSTTGGAALWSAQYDGQALVTNQVATEHAVRNGIGRAKAYGCGLLSLAPTRT